MLCEGSIQMPEDPHPSSNIAEMTWLADVLEIRQPLTETNPIWVRERNVVEGLPTATPERHPYCEINIVTEGTGDVMVEGHAAFRPSGTVELLGPGVPHWGRIIKYPNHSLVVYFLPSVLIEMGPAGDGMRLLRRFTARQTMDQRVVQPSRKVFQEIKEKMQAMVYEFNHQPFGHELRLRTLLTATLVTLIRWELENGQKLITDEIEEDWRPVMRTLQFLREHYTEPIYADQVARAAGVSESRLKVLFHKVLGVTWVKFLQGYRITRAAALLHSPGHNVTEAAFAVGFESLSHFNTVFRAFLGASPKNYMLMKKKNIQAKPAVPANRNGNKGHSRAHLPQQGLA